MRKIITFLLIIFNSYSFGQELSPDSVRSLIEVYKAQLDSDTIDINKRTITRIKGKGLYRYVDRYPSGAIASNQVLYDVTGKSDNIVIPGSSFFYESGQVKKIERKLGGGMNVVEYYKNGQVYREYDLTNLNTKQIKSVNDPHGKILVEDFVGNSVEYNVNDEQYNLVNYSPLLEVGAYRNLRKNGTWMGYYDSGLPAYVEVYTTEDKLIGKSWDENRREYSYEKIYLGAEFKGGEKALMNFLAKNLRNSYMSSGENAGLVRVKFVITKDGKVNNITHTNDALAHRVAEAYRIVKATDGKWEPSRLRGIPIDNYYTLSIVISK